jgi:predicted lactoylglutathione lyase
MNESTAAEIDRSIYGMPMFANFTVTDVIASESFYHALGFITLATILGRDGKVQLVHLRRMRYQDILMTVGAGAGTGPSITFDAGGQDLGELASRANGVRGAVVTGPIDTPWFTTDVTVQDLDGNRVIFTAPRMSDRAAAVEWAVQNISGDFEAPSADFESAQPTRGPR